MVVFRERNNPVKLFGKRLLLLGLFVAALLMFPGVWKVYTQERESRMLRNEATQELSELQERERRLREKTEALNTEYGLETALREQFSLARQGEKLIVIVDRSPTETETQERQDILHWFERLLNW